MGIPGIKNPAAGVPFWASREVFLEQVCCRVSVRIF